MGMPKVVLVPEQSSDPELYQEWLSELRGSNVEIRVPHAGRQTTNCSRPSPPTPRGVHPPSPEACV